MIKSVIRSSVVFLLSILLVFSCGAPEERTIPNSFVVQMNVFSNPNQVNPLYYNSSTERLVCNLLFQPLLSVNDSLSGIAPILASDLPQIVEGVNGDIIHYKLKHDAKWSDGTSVSSNDVLFSYKSFLNPHAELSFLEDYFSFIDSVVILNDLEFDIYCNSESFDNLFRSGDFEIMPEALFDPNLSLRQYSFQEIKDYDQNLSPDSILLQHGNFLKDIRILEKDLELIGSGPYYIESFSPNQSISLRKKNDWWGNKYRNTSFYFQANPDEVEIKIYLNELPATMDFINGQLNVLYGVDDESSRQLIDEDHSNFKTISYTLNAVVYLSINAEHSLMKDRNARKAMAFLSGSEDFTKKILNGKAKPVNSIIDPENKRLFNPQLEDISLNTDSAKFYLEKAGWELKSNQWFKNGEEITIEFLMQAGNQYSEDYAIFFKNNAAKIGLEVQLISLEFSALISRIRDGDYMMTRLGTSIGPIFTNYRSMFHSSAIGSKNYPRFNNIKADSIIELIELEQSSEHIPEMVKELQQLIYQDYAFVFLYRPGAVALIDKEIKGFYKIPTSSIPWPGSFYLEYE